MNVGRLTPADYATILEQHASFWGERDLRAAHHPVLVHELAGSSIALRDGDELVGYLFGFVVPETGVGYVHLVGVRGEHRRRGLATRLWEEFEKLARARGATSLKAITTPANEMSIGFHSSLGMGVQRVADYAGPGHDRIVFTRPLDEPGVVLDHVQVAAPAGSEDEARRFYGELLGLRELDRPEAHGGGGVWFALGRQELHVGIEPDGFMPATKAHPGLRMSSEQLDHVANLLEAAGETVRWDDRLGDRRNLYTDDPWGNRVELLAKR